MAYLYRHIRLDKNEPFYIGIGTDINGKYRRAYNKTKRNIFWKNIINKTKYEVEIILEDLTLEEANRKEMEFIKLYGRRDKNQGTLVNLTDGGDGTKGFSFSPSEETRKKLSISGKGRKISNETIEIIRITHTGKILSEETKNKISRSHIGKESPRKGCKLSKETKERLSEINKGNKYKEGYKASEETKEKIRISKIGKKQSKESSRKRTETRENRKSKSSNKVVKCIENNKIYISNTEAGKDLNLSPISIGKVCNGKIKATKGYHFYYL